MVSEVEAVSILLKQFSCPICLYDMIPRFGRPLPQLSMIASEVTSFVYDIYHEELRIMQNSIKDADYLPFLCHISPRISGRLENTSFEVVDSNRTSVYKGIASFAHAHYEKI